MQKTICNMCGHEFDFWDEEEGFAYNGLLGYGSKYDGSALQLNLCCECMDKIIESCKISPLDEQINVHNPMIDVHTSPALTRIVFTI